MGFFDNLYDAPAGQSQQPGNESVAEGRLHDMALSIGEMSQQVKALNAAVAQLAARQPANQQPDARDARIEELEKIVKMQHNQLIQFKEDLVWRAQKNLVLEIIGIADNLRMMLQKQKEHADYAELLDDTNGLLGWVNSALANNGVSSYSDTLADNTKFDGKRQTIVESVASADGQTVDTYESELPGYEWLMPFIVIDNDVHLQNVLGENKRPKSLGFVIRKEEVVKHRRSKSQAVPVEPHDVIVDKEDNNDEQ